VLSSLCVYSLQASKSSAFSYHLSILQEGVFKSFRTGRLERELLTVQLSATRCICIAILWILPP